MRQVKSVLPELEAEVAVLESCSQYRTLELVKGVNLCSNDYLNLASDDRLKAAIIQALDQGVAVGSTGSRLLSGNSEIWQQLERELARFIGAGTALYFSSGYAANVGLLSCIAGHDDIFFSDSANHASLIDGMRLSGARKVIYPHLDLDALESGLREHASHRGRKFIVTESVFSMDGDRAPLVDMVALAEKHGAELIVDEAHAIGVFGPHGRGLVAEARLTNRVLAAIYPCGKALAGMGAFVCGIDTLKEFLINRARTFIFSTALPPYLAAQMLCAIRIVHDAQDRRRILARNSSAFRTRLREAGFDTLRSDTQIVPVLLQDNQSAIWFARFLQSAGFAVRAIRPPTVPPGTARLRLSLTCGLSPEVLDHLANEMIRIREDRGKTLQLTATGGLR